MGGNVLSRREYYNLIELIDRYLKWQLTCCRRLTAVNKNSWKVGIKYGTIKEMNNS